MEAEYIKKMQFLTNEENKMNAGISTLVQYLIRYLVKTGTSVNGRGAVFDNVVSTAESVQLSSLLHSVHRLQQHHTRIK